MINTKQKSRKDSGIIKKAETQHTIMENHHFTKEGRNREKIKKKWRCKITKRQIIR